MLDAYVIDEIKRRERGRDIRPRAEVPPPNPPNPPGPPTPSPGGGPDGGDRDRGVVIIDYA